MLNALMDGCPLLPKRTSQVAPHEMSAFDPKQTPGKSN
jgi:hypothetical protein